MSFKLEDSGPEKTRQMMARLFGKKPRLKVGIFGQAGDEQHEDSDLSVLAIATFHEFGLGVPERSFIRAWCDANQANVEERLHKDWELVVKGELQPEVALERLGLFIVGGIQSYIAEGIDPPLKYREGTPLINTGQLRSSITYALEDAGNRQD